MGMFVGRVDSATWHHASSVLGNAATTGEITMVLRDSSHRIAGCNGESYRWMTFWSPRVGVISNGLADDVLSTRFEVLDEDEVTRG